MNYASLSNHIEIDSILQNEFRDYNNTLWTYVRNCAFHLSWLKYLTAYSALHGLGFKFYSVDTITRNAYNVNNEVVYKINYFRNRTYTILNSTERESYNIDQEYHVKIVGVTGNITSVFEQAIPAALQTIDEAVELTGVSLALKCTPKHRVRAIKVKDNTLMIFTTKYIPGLAGGYDQDCIFLRKLVACLPAVFNFTDRVELTDLFKYHKEDDASPLANMYQNFFSALPMIVNKKYEALKQMINNHNTYRKGILHDVVDRIDNEIRALLSNYADYLKNRDASLKALNAMDMSEGMLEDEVIKMLVDKKIAYDFKQINNSVFTYSIEAPCLSFDKDAAEKYYKNNILRNDNVGEFVKKLFKAIFIDEKAIMIFNETIKVNLADAHIDARAASAQHDLHVNLPNPHHYYYNCWGSYGATLTKQLREFDFENFFYQIKAAVGSINMIDYTVLSRFLDHLEAYCYAYDTSPRAFIIPGDNTRYTAKELLEKLEEENNETDSIN